MGYPLRYIPEPNTPVEVTVNCFQDRKLLRPSQMVNLAILGCLGRAQELYREINLIAYQFLSTHFHLDCAPVSAELLSAFMNHLLTNISKEVGRTQGWSGAFWKRRYRAIPILDDAAALDRLKYTMSNGVKENLVERVSDWPGVSSTNALITGEPDVGIWYDRSALYRARRTKAGKGLTQEDFAIKYPVELTTLECLLDESDESRVHIYETIIDEIEETARVERELDAIPILGAEAVLAADPQERPTTPQKPKTPAPLCHTSTKKTRVEYLLAYANLTVDYGVASKAFRDGEMDAEFPLGTFRPNGAFVPLVEDKAPS